MILLTRETVLNNIKNLKLSVISLLIMFTCILTSPLSYAADKNWTITDYKDSLVHIDRSPELVLQIDRAIETLPKDAPQSTEIDLHLWKLVVLAKLQEANAATGLMTAGEVASEIYSTYDREMYDSEVHYGETMYQIVESLSKTDQRDISYDIIQNLRESVYDNPSHYLSYTIDRSLIEVYIETYDYRRALNVALSVLENPDYKVIDDAQNSRPSLLNEIAFLYNRLGDGQNALVYLDYAEKSFKKKNLTFTQRIKADARSAGNRARSYILLGQYERAEELGQVALDGGLQLGEEYMFALGYRLVGSAAYHLGKYDKANIALDKGIELAEAHNLVVMKKILFNDYSMSLAKVGRHEEALLWQRRLYELQTDVHIALTTTRARLSDVEFEALKSHQEIVKLRKENEAQRYESEHDEHIKKLLMVTIFSLLAGGGVLVCLLLYMRRAQILLRKSEQKAQIANQAKSDFLATMSHEIRTPMNGVLGMAQVLGRTPLSEQQKFYVNIMTRSGENLLSIINDILDFSKIEADKLTLRPQEESLDQTLQDIAALLLPRAEEKSIALNYSFAPNLPKNFIFDSHRVKQVVTNLAGNAVKFTSKGHVNIDVVGQVDTKQKQGEIEIRITDTGIGISEEKLSVIFDKFTQAETSTTRNYGGTGLGLAISRKLVEAMGGKLSVTSKLGEGSTFIVKLPLDVAIEKSSQNDVRLEAPSDAQDGLKELKAAPLHSPLKEAPNNMMQAPVQKCVEDIQKPRKFVPSFVKPKTGMRDQNTIDILVVEDNEINQTVILSMLDHPKINLTIANNGKEAVEAYERQKFNMILMDISMPVMDGTAATKLIREKEALEGRKRTPIICLTAHAMRKHEEEFIQAGMDGYLAKPVRKNELLDLMRVWLKPQKSAA